MKSFAQALPWIALLMSLSACFPGTGTPVPTPVVVAYTYPLASQAAYPTNAAAYFKFNTEIDAGLLNQSSVTAQTSDGLPVEVELQAHELELLVKPKTAWPANTQVTLTLDASLQDIQGRTLGNDYPLTFTTAQGPDLAPLTVVSTSTWDMESFKCYEPPLSGCALGGQFRFNKSVNPISARGKVELVATPSDPQYTTSVYFDFDTYSTVHATTSHLPCEYDIDVRITVDAGIEDFAGNSLAESKSISFHSTHRCDVVTH